MDIHLYIQYMYVYVHVQYATMVHIKCSLAASTYAPCTCISDYQPSDRFKTVWTALKLSGQF